MVLGYKIIYFKWPQRFHYYQDFSQKNYAPETLSTHWFSTETRILPKKPNVSSKQPFQPFYEKLEESPTFKLPENLWRNFHQSLTNELFPIFLYQYYLKKSTLSTLLEKCTTISKLSKYRKHFKAFFIRFTTFGSIITLTNQPIFKRLNYKRTFGTISFNLKI